MSVNLSKDTANKLNLRKEVVVDLVKRAGIGNQKAQVVLVMDISGSMSTMYNNGTVQEVIERVVPMAMQFDDNQSIDLFLFNNNSTPAGEVTLNNLEGFVRNSILGKYQFGGTSYAPVIADVRAAHSGGTAKPKGLFGGFFSKSPEPKSGPKLPTYVVFVTDGDNDDHGQTERAIREASNEGIFWQFIGIGRAGFAFLDKLDNLSGRAIDNANFFKADDINRLSDAELYSLMLAEFPQWLGEARSRSLID